MIFLGCLFNKNTEKQLLDSSRSNLPNAANTFQWSLIDGFLSNGENLRIVNVLPVGTFPRHFKKLFLKNKAWQYKGTPCQEIGCLNLPFFKQFGRYKQCQKILKASPDKDIFIYSAYEPFLRAAYKLPKEYRITLMVPDLPEYYDLSATSTIRQIARKHNNKKIRKYLQRVNNYVLLTSHMKNKLPIDHKPYLVIEGICQEPEKTKNPSKPANKKIILYAGSYRLSNGIGDLLAAFHKIQDDHLELWLCGKGEATTLIKDYSEKDPRIKDLGYQTHAKITELEKQASLLVNPRPSTGAYTKYSFPSKTMEYMASGTPVLMYQLDGVPKEYYNHLYCINGKTTEDFSQTIIKILNKSPDELADFGAAAQAWVIKNKNAQLQTKKIAELMYAKK